MLEVTVIPVDETPYSKHVKIPSISSKSSAPKQSGKHFQSHVNHSFLLRPLRRLKLGSRAHNGKHGNLQLLKWPQNRDNDSQPVAVPGKPAISEFKGSVPEFRPVVEANLRGLCRNQ